MAVLLVQKLDIKRHPRPLYISLSFLLHSLLSDGQERIIERLKEQREKEEREKGEEVESSKKELKDLREKVSQLQADLADREVRRGRARAKTRSRRTLRKTQAVCVSDDGGRD